MESKKLDERIVNLLSKHNVAFFEIRYDQMGWWDVTMVRFPGSTNWELFSELEYFNQDAMDRIIEEVKEEK